MGIELPARLWEAHDPFSERHARRVAEGRLRLAMSSVAIVGLARNCGDALSANLGRLTGLVKGAGEWRLHIESNDCDDHTPHVLANFCREHAQATFHYQVLNRASYGAEFAGRRTIAMAEYRDLCQRWVRACAGDADYVIAIDFDQWGGWSLDGVLSGLAWLVEMPGAYGMSSVSLFQYDFGNGPQWAHYDLWALRGVGQAGCYYDTYTNGYGGWGYGWLPPVGSPPVLVASAFGGLTIYRRDAYLKGTYDGTQDCEHVPLHQSIARATGQNLYLNPSQRCVMHWLPEDAPNDSGQHGNN